MTRLQCTESGSAIRSSFQNICPMISTEIVEHLKADSIPGESRRKP